MLSHIYLAWIHPFGDGNGRTARLIELHILLGAGVPMPAAHLLSNHYNETRPEYYRHLDATSKSGGEVLPFLQYALQGFVEGLRQQLTHIWQQQWDMTWRNHIYEIFNNKKGSNFVRQRSLALHLGDKGDWIEIEKICDLASDLARAYILRTNKTLQRDLKALQDWGLIERKTGRVRAKREIIFSFLPVKSNAR